MGDVPDEAAREGDLPTVEFHYIKSYQFRVVHADGVVGGITPHGNVHASFFSERGAIPQRVTHGIQPNGELGPEVSRATRAGAVREVEVDVVMSLQTARGFRDWLDGHIAQLEAMLEAAKSKKD